LSSKWRMTISSHRNSSAPSPNLSAKSSPLIKFPKSVPAHALGQFDSQ
jgi:hypothetical protein